MRKKRKFEGTLGINNFKKRVKTSKNRRVYPATKITFCVFLKLDHIMLTNYNIVNKNPLPYSRKLCYLASIFSVSLPPTLSWEGGICKFRRLLNF